MNSSERTKQSISRISNPLGPDAVWRDKYSQKVEDFLGAVVDTFSAFAKQGKERLRQKEIEDKKRAEAERRRYEEQQRVRRLTGQLKAWKEVRDSRDYIQAVESTVIARNGKVDPADGVSQWIAWMKNYADSIDPSQREDLGRENEWEWSYENSTYSR